MYKEALPYLWCAHELSASDRTSVRLLLSIYFRFRHESPEMLRNYEKFRDMLRDTP